MLGYVLSNIPVLAPLVNERKLKERHVDATEWQDVWMG